MSNVIPITIKTDRAVEALIDRYRRVILASRTEWQKPAPHETALTKEPTS